MKTTDVKDLDVKINSHKIKSRIFELGLTQEFIAKKIGLNYTTFNLKLNNKRQITLFEVASLSKVLEIKDVADFIEYFGLGFLNLSLIRENAKMIEADAKGA